MTTTGAGSTQVLQNTQDDGAGNDSSFNGSQTQLLESQSSYTVQPISNANATTSNIMDNSQNNVQGTQLLQTQEELTIDGNDDDQSETQLLS